MLLKNVFILLLFVYFSTFLLPNDIAMVNVHPSLQDAVKLECFNRYMFYYILLYFANCCVV